MISPQNFFGLLSDETRLRCLMLLQREKKLCVCELSQTIGMSQPKISRHLALLRQSNLVSDERRGQWVYYCIKEQLDPHLRIIINGIAQEFKDLEPFQSDYENLRKIHLENLCSPK
jgi:ArsR family transcriptional regulator, arsenate/arsenite/antimonite-responsive transcriptional repressor